MEHQNQVGENKYGDPIIGVVIPPGDLDTIECACEGAGIALAVALKAIVKQAVIAERCRPGAITEIVNSYVPDPAGWIAAGCAELLSAGPEA